MLGERGDIKEIVDRLRQRLQRGEDPIEVLDGAFQGRAALVISAGPSMRRWREMYERERHTNPVVVCVKQTLLGIGELCDLHFVNPYNHQKYSEGLEARLVVFTDIAGAPDALGHRDVTFRTTKPSGSRIEDTLAATREFARWDLRRSGLSRPWGPGIMHESVLYTLLHMGVERIVTVGWDIADDRGGNAHYYDANRSAGAQRARDLALRIRNRLMRIPALGTAMRFALHHSGHRYNPPSILKGEAHTVSQSLHDFLLWFRTRGMEIQIVSDSQWITENCEGFVSTVPANRS